MATFLAFVVSHMKRGRGRPSSKPSARAPKALALSADVVITQDFDERGRPRTPLVEVARRTEGTGLLVEEKILFLRVCAAVRRSDSIRVRVGSNWEFPSPISLAATLCDISDRVAHEIHAQFQREKQLPDASQRGQYARKLELEQLNDHNGQCVVSQICDICCDCNSCGGATANGACKERL